MYKPSCSNNNITATSLDGTLLLRNAAVVLSLQLISVSRRSNVGKKRDDTKIRESDAAEIWEFVCLILLRNIGIVATKEILRKLLKYERLKMESKNISF